MKAAKVKHVVWTFVSGRLFRTAAIALSMVLAGMTSPGVSQIFDTPPPSLKELPARAQAKGVPLEAPNLMDFVKDKDAAIKLGKALFWDMQLGSDGVVACATCHFHAGSDVRPKNQLNPGLLDQYKKTSGDPRFGNSTVGSRGYKDFGPDYELKREDFPLHKREHPERQRSNVLQDTNDVISSQGVVLKKFTGIGIGSSVDSGEPLSDPVFQMHKQNTRRVEPVNAPTVHNAVFNFAGFVNGRANHFFNGENPFGPAAGPDAGIWINNGGALEKKTLNLPLSSLASQAVGPPVSDLEMSWRGRTWAEIGKKMLSLEPLGKQNVDPSDSVLGLFSKYPAQGLNTTYEQLIMNAFKDQFWNSTGNVIKFDAASAPLKDADPQDPRTFKLNNGKATVKARDSQVLSAEEYTHMEANFAFFFGLAVQLYESTLVSDDSPFDRYMEGRVSLNDEELRGMQLFFREGRCNQCHGGSLFTNAAIDVVMRLGIAVDAEGLIEPMPVATGVFSLYDTGFYNIGVRPTTEDVGRGGTAPFINPLTASPFPLSHTRLARLKAAGLLPDWYLDYVPVLPAVADWDAVDGAMKTPGLRNVELTGPYFRNGDSVTLMQVVDFYTRGGNFPRENRDNLSPFMGEIFSLQGNDADQKALVAFLLTLTDERVKYEKAPFDHPQLFVVNGHNEKTLEDEVFEIPAVGAVGRNDPLRPFLAPAGVDSYTFHTTP